MNTHQTLILKVTAGWMLLLFLFPPPNGKIDGSALPGYRKVAVEATTRHNLYPCILQQLLAIENDKLRLKKNAVDWRRLKWEYQILVLVALVLLVASRGEQHDDDDDNRDGEGPPVAPDPHGQALHRDARQLGVSV